MPCSHSCVIRFRPEGLNYISLIRALWTLLLFGSSCVPFVVFVSSKGSKPKVSGK